MEINSIEKKSYISFFLLKTLMRTFIFLCCTIVFAFAPSVSTSQNADVSIGYGRKMNIKQVFKLINNQTDYKFIYRDDLLSDVPELEIKKGIIKTSVLLKRFLNPVNLTYNFTDDLTIVVIRKPDILNISSSTIPLKVAVQQIISGTITDQNGNPLPGANILEKGTTNGTQADFDGNFSIQISSENAVLVVSYLGFATKEIPLSGQTEIIVELEESAAGLDEVVVVGYGSQRKADVTGSVVRVTTDRTANLANTNVFQSIQGLAPGINVSAGSNGTVGEDPNILVRGTNSLTASNRPLIVVDDVIYNGSISDFNSNDIESIDILKDASATAVYGARAANGVLLITTKRGVTSKPLFNFATYTGFQVADELINVLDGPGYEQKISDYNEILLAENPNADPIVLTNVERNNKANGNVTDWMDEVLRTAQISNYHLDVSGASEKTNYYISGTYFNQEGIVLNDKFERLTLNLNVTNQLTDWLSLGIRSTYSFSDLSGVPAGTNSPLDLSGVSVGPNGLNETTNLDYAPRQSPYGNFFDESGPGGYAFFPIGDPLGIHPLLTTLVDDENKRSSLRGVFSLKIDFPFLEGLKLTSNYGANIREDRQNRFINNRLSTQAETQNGIAYRNYSRNFDWTFDNILNYKRIFNDRHSVDLTFLLSRESRNLDQTFARANDFVSQDLGFNALNLGAVQLSASNRESQNSLSQLGRINYGLDNKYSFTYTVRRDGFSAFAENNKYAVFQAGAFAWTITNENFLNKSNWLNYLKLRVSAGENGNQAIDRYSSIARINNSQYIFGNDGGSTATFGLISLANNDLSWETTFSKNLGLDFQLFDSRLSGTVDVYQSNTEDLLQLRSIPSITGFETILTNIGEVENKGVEFSLNSTNILNEKFSWQTGFVFSLNRNKIITLGGVDADENGIEDDDISNGWFIGEDINSIFGYKTNGIYQEDDVIPDNFRPGDFKIMDTNDDGIIGPDDRQILGTTSPNYIFSLSNTFNYKQFSLYVLINSTQGGGSDNFYVGDNYDTRSVNRRTNTTFSERFNVQDVPYWTPSNPTNNFPRLDYSPPFDHPILEDRSFTRIQDVSLSYNFKSQILDKIGLTNLKFFTSIKNLHTFTNWTGYNPETASTVQNLPLISSYTFGLDLSF